MKKTVLIVDDEEDLIDIVESHLEDAGYAVISAINGHEALEAAKNSKPDLIILDIAMPGMTGLEMLEILRGIPPIAATPVIMLTAQGQSANIFAADKLKVTDFLIKPFTQEELLEAVSKVI